MKKKTLLAFAAALGPCLALALCLGLLFAAGVFGARGAEPAAAGEVTEPAISARGAILIDAKDGSVLYEKNAHEKMYPASTTKIMTALVVLQILEEIDAGPDSHLVVPAEAAVSAARPPARRPWKWRRSPAPAGRAGSSTSVLR